MSTEKGNLKLKRRESNYPAVRPGDCLLDPANPGWYIRDYSQHGKALKADYKMLRDRKGQIIESAETYWNRVRKEIMTEAFKNISKGREFNTDTQEWETKEPNMTPDQVDAAIAEKMEAMAAEGRAKQIDLPETDTDEDEDTQERRPF